MARFHVQNFGCRASQADGAAIESLLENKGFDRADDWQHADYVVLNTCTVTSTADDEVRQIVRRVHRTNPDARIVVTGCYAQRAPEEIAALPGVSLVVGNSHKTQLAELVTQTTAEYHGEVRVSDVFAQQDFLASPVENASGDRSRPNLKIQDGCSNRCSFCIIPSVRGRSRSAPTAQIIDQVQRLAVEYPEVVLTGINLGRWGREHAFANQGERVRLVDLLRLVLAETLVRRLRLSSVEPMDWSDDLLEMVASSERIAQHIHIPLQSGCDAVLRRMHRKYRTRHYETRVRLAREWMPDAAIGADVMAGFPGETDSEFEETCAFIESLPLTYLHVFPYSERPGTAAAEMDASVPWVVRKERGRRLKQISERKSAAFRRSMVGRSLSAVTLGNGMALTSNYIQVELATPRPARQLIDVPIGPVTEHGVREQQLFPVLD